MLEPEDGKKECQLVQLVGTLTELAAAMGEDMTEDKRKLAMTLAHKWNSDMTVTRDIAVTMMASAAMMTSLLVAASQVGVEKGGRCLCGSRSGHWSATMQQFRRERQEGGEERGLDEVG